jgi:hypothetical protein
MPKGSALMRITIDEPGLHRGVLDSRHQARYLALLEDWSVAEHREEVKILKRRIEDGLR